MSDRVDAHNPGDKADSPAGASLTRDLPASFFRTVIDTANEGIWMIDSEGREATRVVITLNELA